MTPLFLDTSFLIALESASDQRHQEAKTFWQTFRQNPSPLVTTSYVLNEAATFFNSRGHHAKAVEIGHNLLESPALLFLHIDEELFHEGWRYFQRHSDKRYSLGDCVSFIVMRRLNIRAAIAFDHHFTQAGFDIVP